MATKEQKTIIRSDKPHKINKGVHAKTKTSKNKNSTNYKKPNVGQGSK